MDSEQNEGTSYQKSESRPCAPRPCANNCGFWGRSDTMHLCSKCYKDIQMKAQQATLEKFAMEKSLEPEMETSSTQVDNAPELPFIVPVHVLVDVVESVPKKVQKAANRCNCCNKKVGLTGFKCKCGLTFCGNHRYPELHECSFDFQSAGCKEIAKANPIVKADKVERI